MNDPLPNIASTNAAVAISIVWLGQTLVTFLVGYIVGLRQGRRRRRGQPPPLL